MALRPIAALALCVVVSWAGACSALNRPEDPTEKPADSGFKVSPPLLGSMIAEPGKLIWADDFSGGLGEGASAKWWTPLTGGNGWGNREIQCYTDSRENSATNGEGQLVISAVHQKGQICSDGAKNDWTSARLTTEGKFSAQYGRLEVRAKLPVGRGTWPAFWGLGINHSEVGWPRSGEIDVMEYIGNRPTESSGTISSERLPGQPSPKHRYFQRKYPVAAQELTQGFHAYAVDWTPTAITYSRDGKIFGQVTKSEVTKTAKWPFDQPFYLILNLAMGGNYGKSVPESLTATQRYMIDYVRVYGPPAGADLAR